MDDKYKYVDSSDVMNILQGELLNRLKGRKIPNNSKGLTLLETEANQVCKDILSPYVSENVNIIAESKGEHDVHIHWTIPGEEGYIDKD